MSDQRLSAADQGPGHDGRARHALVRPGLGGRIKKRSRVMVAGALIAGLMGGALAAAPALAADGGSGGGGTGGSGGGTSGNWQTFYAMRDGYTPDGPLQGYMGDSMNYFFNLLGAPEAGMQPKNAYTDMQISCTAALNNAESRRPASAPAGKSRVVGMYWASHKGATWGTASVSRDRFRDLYNEWVANGRPGMSAEYLALPNYANLIEAGFNEGFNSVPAASATTICLAVNESETPVKYDLAVSTDKASSFTLAGSSNAVADNINLSTDSPIRENVWVETWLNWGGVEGNGRRVSKSAPIANYGTSQSPSFTPGDFGWASWPAGNFWFDVVVPVQGQMNAEVSHAGQNDPRENWSAATTAPRKILTTGSPADQLGAGEVLTSGMFYNAEVTARTNGFASSMTITDTVNTDQVWIGSQTADVLGAPYIVDPSGARVAGASIQITRPAGKVVVSGTVTGIPDGFQAREYTLVVPTYVRPTTTDYTIADDSGVCYTAARNNCITGNSAQTRKVTPAPDKVWVLDENGALVAADPGHTNQAGADNKTFAPGSAIGAVVNGKIPAGLAENMSSYSITDDWTGAARYIDFSDASKAKVFLNGADVTSQFDVAVVGTTTVATAKPEFLASTKGLAQARTVKLYIGGIFRTDYDTGGALASLTNAGSERWNNQTVQTNTPPIYTITPNPDKVWVLDEEGGLVAFDPNNTNTVGADTKTFAPGASISAVVNGSIPSSMGTAFSEYSLTDDWTAASTYVDFSDASKAKVFLDGVNVTSQFDIVVTGTVTKATAKPAFLATTANRAAAGVTKLIISGQFRNTYDTDGALAQLTNGGGESWNNQLTPTNTPPIYTVTPTPNKVWVLDENGALVAWDKDWTNIEGADGAVFLPNDAVAAVVNGSIPANLGAALTNYVLTDDWTGAADYVDFSDASRAKVFVNGVDATSQFTITVVGTKTIATARPAFLATTLNRATAADIKLVISGTFRDDYDTDGVVVELINAGSETWNNRTQATNTPPVYTWTPNPNKQVIGSSEESGDKTYADINGASVWPGQKLEYSVGIDLRIPGGTARGIKSLAVEDVYDPYFTPDKHSVEFWDSRDTMNPRPVPKSAYKLVFNEAAHTFTATFTQAWIDANVGQDGANNQWLNQGWLTMRVTGTVSKNIPAGSTVVNQAFQIINGARTATEIPVVEIPTVTPDKEDLSTDLIDINGKTLVTGDVVLYRLTLDGGPVRDQLAYNVHKLGIVDDYDEEYLSLDEGAITVTDKATGADVTAAFNVSVIDGVAYVFAKQVDTEDPFGGIIPGDPQPGDLGVYDQAPIRPLEDPIIDQSLLGKKYWVTLRATVSKVTDGHVIENQARQNIQNTYYSTRVVSNPLKDIDPSKDVVIDEDSESIGETEVRLNTMFNYRLGSSEIPANRAYAATQWSMSDTFDRVHDSYTGIWAVYASTDVYDGAELVFAKGSLLADSADSVADPYKGLFAATFDEGSYTFSIEATSKYLDLIGTRPDLANAFSVYTKMERIAPSERIENVVGERYNTVERESNVVWTKTYEYPEVEVKKFTHSEGETDGDRNDVRLAYPLTAEQLAPQGEATEEDGAEDSTDGATQEPTPAPTDADQTGQLAAGDDSNDNGAADPTDEPSTQLQLGVDVGVRFTNTGDAPLVDVSLLDVRHDDLYGDMEDLLCIVPAGSNVSGLDTMNPDGEGPSGTGGSGMATGSSNAAVIDADGVWWAEPSAITRLAVGQVVNCKGTLRGMEPGMTHGDTVVVTGASIFSGVLVKDEDPWFAVASSTPSVAVEKFTLAEGKDTGDRDTFEAAYDLTEDEATTGVQLGFEVTNTGDEALTGFSLADVTQESTTGTVGEIVWLDELVETDEDGNAIAAPAEAVITEVAGVRYIQRPLAELTDLAVGQTELLVGTLTGVEPGTAHVNLVTVTGTGLYSGTAVTASDPWNAKLGAPQPPPVDPPKPPAGAVTGEVIGREGTDFWFIGGAAALLVAAAGAVYGIRRRQLAAVLGGQTQTPSGQDW